MSVNYGRISFSRPSDSGGFFSNYFSVLSTMGICLSRGLIPYVDATNTWFNPTCNFIDDSVSDVTINPWDWWFIQEKEEGATFVELGLDRGGITHVPSEFSNYYALPLMREVADRHCKIKFNILEEEELLYEQHIKNKNTLGILARGTEMLVHHPEYPKVFPSTWPGVIKFVLDRHPDIGNIFLVSDDRRIIESVLEAYPEVKYLEHFFRSSNQTEEELSNKVSPWWLFSPDGNPDHRKRVGEEALIQTRLLSKCNYFVGSHSGMSNAVNFFRKIPFKANYLI